MGHLGSFWVVSYNLPSSSVSFSLIFFFIFFVESFTFKNFSRQKMFFLLFIHLKNSTQKRKKSTLFFIIQVSRRGFEMERENYEKAEFGEALKRSQNLWFRRGGLRKRVVPCSFIEIQTANRKPRSRSILRILHLNHRAVKKRLVTICSMELTWFNHLMAQQSDFCVQKRIW